MNYKQSTGKSIENAFNEYHEENPAVFEMFKKYLNEILESERKKMNFHSVEMIKEKATLKTSSKLILNRIRWEIATVGLIAPDSEQNVLNSRSLNSPIKRLNMSLTLMLNRQSLLSEKFKNR